MRFKLFNEVIDTTDISYKEPVISNHTGKELQKPYFDFIVKGKKVHEAVQKQIPDAENGGIYSVDDIGSNIDEYKLVNSSYSYKGTSGDENTLYSYTIYLEEVETLDIENLIIDDMEIFPYEYHEEYDHGCIINAKVKLKKDESKKLDILQDKNEYFEVIRNGISEDKKEMRFGQIIWSENEDYIKKNITLVEKVCDESQEDSPHFLQPQMGNMMRMLAYASNLNTELIKLLLAKEVINDEEVKEVKAGAHKDIRKTARNFHEVADIDKF